MNTDGGQLSGGRLHGFGHLHEAALQLRGEAGERQLATRGGAPEVSVVTNGGRQIAGALLLTRDWADRPPESILPSADHRERQTTGKLSDE